MNRLQPLALPRSNVVSKQAFEGDLLNRRKLAEKLTGYLDRLREGAVLAIDARWGEGKSWFGCNWAKYLESEPQNHKVVFIDAFAQDYAVDPFLLIAAEIAGVLDDGKGSGQMLREKAAGVMKALLPVGAKALINLAGRVALGTTSISDEFQEAAKDASEGAADATSKWIEKKLEDHVLEKKSLEAFKVKLAEFAASQDKPVVIFIDELDRCRPTFAVQLIERIKHFFDVPNLVFVLMLNREQLEKAIKGVYGAETDAATYLGKFVHLFFRLPKSSSREDVAYNPASAFIVDVLNRYGFTPAQAALVGDFRGDLLQWVIAANMSLRDIERACALFVMSNAKATGFLTYLIVMKIKYSALYERLVRNEVAAHEQAMDLLLPLIHVKNIDDIEWPDNYFKMLLESHKLQLGADLAKEAPCLVKFNYAIFGHRGFDIKRTFSNVFNLIDLPVENY